jgi:anti-anti-sigma factor
VSVLLVRTSPVQAAPTPVTPTLVTIAGEIDISTVPALRRHLLALPVCSTVVELSGVSLLGAVGVNELVDLRDRLTRADMTLVLAAVRPVVRRVLAITGIADTIALTDTLDDAIYLITAGTAGAHRQHARHP